MATRRPSSASRALYTVPMPPWPIFRAPGSATALCRACWERLYLAPGCTRRGPHKRGDDYPGSVHFTVMGTDAARFSHSKTSFSFIAALEGERVFQRLDQGGRLAHRHLDLAEILFRRVTEPSWPVSLLMISSQAFGSFNETYRV